MGRRLPEGLGGAARQVQDRRPRGAANAEIVLEGWVDRNDVGSRGRLATTPASTRRGPESSRSFGSPRSRCAATRSTRRSSSQAAGGGRVAREGDRAHLPACDPDERARDRRLRPAHGGHLSQLRHRLDPQELPRARAQGDARDVGLGLMSLTKSSSSSTSTSTCTTTSRSSSTSARTSIRPARHPPQRGPIDQLDHATTIQAYGRQDRLRCDREGP